MHSDQSVTSNSSILSDAAQVKTEPVQVKIEPLDNECGKSSESPERSSIWVKVKDIFLTNYDKDILVNGEKLSDKHINLAQRILKSKFPKISGLRLTLLQDKPHKNPTNSELQILHTGGDHWICATTIGTPSGKMYLYMLILGISRRFPAIRY